MNRVLNHEVGGQTGASRLAPCNYTTRPRNLHTGPAVRLFPGQPPVNLKRSVLSFYQNFALFPMVPLAPPEPANLVSQTIHASSSPQLVS